MNITNTQVQTKPASVETLVGNQKQEFPKPSVPAEEKDFTELSDMEATKRAAEENKKFEEKANVGRTTLKQSEKLTAEEEVKEMNVKAVQEKTMDSVQEFKDLQAELQKQKGHQAYQANMGLIQ